MNGTNRSIALAQMASRVDRFAREIDLTQLSPALRAAMLAEIDGVIGIFETQSAELGAALLELRKAVERPIPAAGPVLRDDLVKRRLRRLLQALVPLAASMAVFTLPAAAQQAQAPASTSLIGTAKVGDSVTNTTTGQNETVVQLIGNYSVRTDKNNVILLAQQVGDTYTAAIPDSADPTKTKNVTYTVTAVTKDASDRVTSVTVEDADKVASTSNVVTAITYTTPGSGGGTQTGTNYPFPVAQGDVNQFTRIRQGGNGGDGRDGGGIEVCIPLIGCARISYDPTAGGNGGVGPNFTENVTSANGNITTISAKTPGIVVVSTGGNGGEGGTAVGNIPAARGGNAGSGGNVTANNYVDVVTKGDGSHGMLVQSTAGIAGSGGGCYIACTGGGGGSAGVGGDAVGYNFGNISTSGKGAAGILVQSLGGNAGTGGSSYGIVGLGGVGGVGSNGGSAFARNEGVVRTTGEASHGVMAQSVGGVGGNSGNAGGIVAFGGNGGGAGNGGMSEASASADSRTITTGDFSYGIFSQSVGGGGGTGGIAGGVVAFGASAGTAGTGGTARISLDDGAYVETNGIGAYGVFAQSVGGMGGTANGTGGVFTMGGTGGVGGNGGLVDVTSGATVVTGADGDGKDARGVFAQSVGGGGGSANASGGIVSLGGDGAAAGNGGNVNVKLTKASSITTTGLGATGVYAQSIGGGGGAGASSGGVFAIGGKGDSGGTGGTVTVENQGAITTNGVLSRGIFVQSVGGGGGSGGDGAGLASIGGSGSKTSAGGTVTVSNSGAIVTGANRSNGIQAQSIGGGGGDGGTSGGVFLAIGGSGAGGGAGGTVTVNASGSIETRGDDSHGIMAQAVGGGGGNGGSSTSVSLFAGVAIGGSGDGGGKGGDATVNFTKQTMNVNGVPTAFDPSISTGGDRSRGLFVQSVGGGGGSGGFAVQTSVGIGASVSVALGGKGAGGGEGGTVITTGNASVFTKGANSEGVFAQSVGGGGGAGGYTIATAVTAGDGAAIALGIGGSGGGGGKGGDVTMTSGGSIVTQGEFSTGLMAQSVGGGGGAGGYNVSTSAATGSLASLAVSIGIGGSGAGGGMGGVVDATFDGTIATGGVNGAGSDSAGAIIQSIGGGGGRGGVNTSGSIAAAGAVAVGVSVGLGGSGAGGGDGGQVTGMVGGDVLTTGARSNAVLIQSAGGGGGSGGFNISGTLTSAGGVAGGASIGLGGSGGSGGIGGEVKGTTKGTLTTYGNDSDGLVVQSVGGGGGSGAMNISGNVAAAGGVGVGLSFGLGGSGGKGGLAGKTTGIAEDNVYTEGDRSRGVLVQSTGGGGGAGGFSVDGSVAIGGAGAVTIGVGLGGAGGGGGKAGEVIASARSVTTKGDSAAGFIAQSVGGGGGTGGFAIKGALAVSTGVSGNLGVGVGGSGGGGGAGGTVDATVVGDVVTSGLNSGAVLAQSIGGGGGTGGFVFSGGIAAGAIGAASVNVGVGGSGGSGGSSDAVKLTMTGQTVTRDQDSDGIVAQSLGGGGGSGGFNIQAGLTIGGTGAGTIGVGVGGSGGGGGSAGTVTMRVNDTATASNPLLLASTTLGDRSRGVIAQSIGGGGGAGGFNITAGATLAGTGAATVGVGVGGSGGDGGTGGMVDAKVSGLTTTTGDQSTGVIAQSIGGGGGSGAFNVTGGLTAAGGGAGTVSVGVGGSGGKGGAADSVALGVNAGVVTPTTDLIAVLTTGENADGIVAQSLGGGGGSGGFNVSGTVTLTGGAGGGVSIGIGGSGGGGGDAGKAGAGIPGLPLTDADYSVNATIKGRTATKGLDSDAIIAQSVGGGGGDGGFNVSADLSLSVGIGGTGSLGIGGSGGSGGNAGAVKLRLNEGADATNPLLFAATTEADRSRGIVIESLGGGGGNGGFNLNAGVAIGGQGAGTVSVGIGGSGGGGGFGSSIDAAITGRTSTLGDASEAVVAQSIGGGGGAGGFNVGGGVALAGTGAASVSFGIGGSGGGGGDSGAVKLGINQNVAVPDLTLVAATTDGENSRGVVAQSIGGGGGAGGFNVVGNLAAAGTGSGTVSIGIGGSGGDGGDGSAVDLAIQGRTATLKKGSDGVLAQSVGGGGGNGGFNVSAGLAGAGAGAGAVGFGIGGTGGGGGNSGRVDLDINSGVITNTGLVAVNTSGDDSRGIVAQSLGGGGGNGGFNVTGGVALGGKGSGTLGIGVGGSGGDGGNGGAVDASISGRSVTFGTRSDAVLAQSVGGGGGSGAMNITGGIAIAGDGAGQISVGVGGSGGGGGNADTVDLKVNTGILQPAVDLIAASAYGDNSRGIVAQSVGGGGGDGGFNVTGQLNGAGKGAGGLAVGVGGSGGDGGISKKATAVIQGRTFTEGKDSDGVVVQSVGGGGGSGAFNVTGGVSLAGKGAGTVAIGVGGSGGKGGDGGDAQATINGTVRTSNVNLLAATTYNDRSRGVVVQSLGGGGGNGAFNISGVIQMAGTGAGGASFGVGGSGADAGEAGAAIASITGRTDTFGVESDAIFVQSVGGGGGSGGFNVSAGLSFAGKGAGTLAFGIGGSGGGGGNAGLVDLKVNAGIVRPDLDLVAATTSGGNSRGIVAQSVGGGGGDGAFNISGQISGAGTGAGGMSIGVGGSGGKGGDGGVVTADITGITATTGNSSTGILAQSVGGGGGNGGFNLSASISVAKSGAGNVSIGVGGSGGDGGNADTVTLDVNQRTSDPADTLLAATTSGNSSIGIVAQSVGGGGGNGAFNVSAGIALAKEDAGNAGFGLGGSGGKGGFGSTVTARVNGDIATSGKESGGALVQSVGGGGGTGGFNVAGGVAVSLKGSAGNVMVGVGGYGGDGGRGGDVDATFDSDVLTTNDKSYGATVQSLGGSGGIGGMNITGGVSVSMDNSTAGTLGVGIGGFGGGGGDAGNVKAAFTGDIFTKGMESHGLLVQSQGGGGGDGGMNITGGLAMSQGKTGTIGFGLGGFGGKGGDAGTVDATTLGVVRTLGGSSYGAMFQSIGGAGGNGAINVTGGVNISTGDSTAGAVSIGVGGFGGGGGDGKRVTANVTGAYSTDGVNSAGVVAQSIGGGGGNGGLNIAGTLVVALEGNGGGASFGLGGFGGDGGTSGAVTLTRIGQTVTTKSSSDGVVAQSIGGGGGRGGMNVSGGIAYTTSGDVGTLTLGIGGFGGGGGDAGAVTATVRDSVWASGADAPVQFLPDAVVEATPEGQQPTTRTSLKNGSSGIVIQSLGGGGGGGGINISGGIAIGASGNSSASALAIGIGGFGGSGGDAGIVNATIGALTGPRIQVQGKGDNKSAVYIGSVGGGGGDGAINISGAITTDGSVTAGIGGAGAGGGLGRLVNARVDADLFASGYQASGLTVQSLGGGGGNGGINISGGIKIINRTEPVISFGMGGDGGVGNSSGNVNVQQDGQVVVDGFNVNGVLVQSVAGGGGAGGMNFVTAVNISNGKSQADGFAAGIGVGGSGGSGGVAGDAYLRSTGDVLINTVVTKADDGSTKLTAGAEAGLSSGVTVQSIGGGGGAGGFNLVGVVATKGTPLTVAVGGSGAVGGDAGSVTVVRGLKEDGTVSASLINTFGFSSNGLVAQSIGGGGGSAATNLSFSLGVAQAGKTGYGALFQIGGDGASSGNAKNVDVTHVGSIQTDGTASNGILAQSIGKGGGNAAVNVGIMYLKGAAADGATPAVPNDGFALTMGGAAGDAGSSGNVKVSHDGTIVTKQSMSSAIVAQSLAGGGGNTALNFGGLFGTANNVKMSIGRSGGKGGTAGDVLVTATGLLLAAGDQSNGIVAQSIGGAGGLSGTVTIEGQAQQGSGTDATKTGVGMSVGLEGGAGGHSGAVTVANGADIQTDGEAARGIVAQSIGGDGGVAGSARIITMGQADSVAIALGGGGGSGATASKVSVASSGLIVTKGMNSDGILAQSIGGSGGVAGSATTLKLPTGGLGNKSSSIVTLGVGGTGGDGAIAGDVGVTNTGYIYTNDTFSYGIRAQSIGGGGGVGGSVYNIETQAAKNVNSFNLSVGGGGGTGQAAGRVDVSNYGLIKTTGANASGISANSIGGGGGDAGSVSTVAFLRTGAGGDVNAVSLAIGGSGGTGGAGGAISVINASTNLVDSGTIVTSGAAAHGIFAQSLGGGGGNGSSILSIAVTNGKEDSITGGLNIGGFGGDGNVGGDVTVDNAGFIGTSGEGADGILAQSIGGGGGNGGVVISANISFNARKTSPLVSVGGFGGAGNDGGHVTVINSGQIFTSGKNSDGIVAQSIGGGGGNAGLGLALTGETRTLVMSNLLSLVVGGLGGGKSGLGGQVDVIHSGDITVTGEGSKAIVAESINGGGGSVRFDTKDISIPSIGTIAPEIPPIPPLGEIDGIPNLVAGEPVNKPVAPVIVAARVGSSDVASMNAGKVNVKITGTMGAGGDFGSGVLLRSVGGGGGDLTISGTLVKPDASIAQAFSAQVIYAVGLGAKDSSDSAGGDLDTVHNGDIFTTGRATPGVLLQSIGGGGGSALVNIKTEDAALIDSVRLGLGGVETSSSFGGAIDRTQTGAVMTTKDLSYGGLVQSIGGGGGSAIGNVELTSATPANPASAALRQASIAAVAQPALQPVAVALVAPAIVSLGASGGAANDGGAVDLSFSGGFATIGAYAHGLVVQSIGAGGGNVSLNGLQATSVLLGGTGGASGSGGDIRVDNEGQVITLGTGSNGLLMQSIGGGGGLISGGFKLPEVTLLTDNTGNGGAITLRQTGDVMVLGDDSIGIVAQSLGGGGGLVGSYFAGTAGGVGSGGAISLTIDGSVLATGGGSNAILAQSLGSLGAGNISVATNGDVRGGSGTGAAIRIDGGAGNTVRSSGTLSSVSGLAVVAGMGNDQVINTGLAVGNFKLGGGANTLVNASGATLVTIDTIDLKDGVGSTGTFTNAGQLKLGLAADPYPIDLLAGATQPVRTTADPKSDLLFGTRVISRVALDGDFVQTRTGNSQFDVAFGPYASDRFDVTGKATVAGSAGITLTWLENSNQVSLWAAAGGGVDNGLVIPDTLAIDYRVIANAQGIQLGFTSNFAQPFLNRNEQAIGRSLDSAVTVGNAAGLGRLLALLGNLSAGQEGTYKRIMGELDPEPLLAPALVEFAAARDFSSNILGCTGASQGTKCVWGRVDRSDYRRTGKDGDQPFEQKDIAQLRTGIELPFQESWALAGAIGYDDGGDLRFNAGRATAKFEGVHGGIALRKYIGADGQGSLSVGVAGGIQWVDTTRRQSVFVDGVGKSKFKNDYIAFNANARYTLNSGALFARPEINVSYVGLGQRSFEETGLLGLGVEGLRNREWFVTATPSLALGVHLSDAVQFSVHGGAVLHNRSSYEAPLRLIGADNASDPALISTRFDKTAFTGGVDLLLLRQQQFSVDVGYRGEWGETTRSQNLRLKMTVAF